ncbi:hypothetical protein DUI87_03099 [Hirundo rustica rustica]|uniref:Uncharacterized protein n=1 Tax=Hirundo rustica rustica TaxID=333673 RepID=A0A3M0L1V9_HIRRU|nr:hypothetical protein DUI87_03099 [Hirundo rustica rustica]
MRLLIALKIKQRRIPNAIVTRKRRTRNNKIVLTIEVHHPVSLSHLLLHELLKRLELLFTQWPLCYPSWVLPNVGEDEARKPYKYDCLDSENVKPISEIELKDLSRNRNGLGKDLPLYQLLEFDKMFFLQHYRSYLKLTWITSSLLTQRTKITFTTQMVMCDVIVIAVLSIKSLLNFL